MALLFRGDIKLGDPIFVSIVDPSQKNQVALLFRSGIKKYQHGFDWPQVLWNEIAIFCRLIKIVEINTVHAWRQLEDISHER